MMDGVVFMDVCVYVCVACMRVCMCVCVGCFVLRVGSHSTSNRTKTGEK